MKNLIDFEFHNISGGRTIFCPLGPKAIALDEVESCKTKFPECLKNPEYVNGDLKMQLYILATCASAENMCIDNAFKKLLSNCNETEFKLMIEEMQQNMT